MLAQRRFSAWGRLGLMAGHDKKSVDSCTDVLVRVAAVSPHKEETTGRTITPRQRCSVSSLHRGIPPSLADRRGLRVAP